MILYFEHIYKYIIQVLNCFNIIKGYINGRFVFIVFNRYEIPHVLHFVYV